MPPASKATQALNGPVRALLWLFLLLLSLAPTGARAQEPAPSDASREGARSLVHVLNYLSRDYGAAVEEGRVLNEAEYAEQREFAAEARRLAAAVGPLAGDERFLGELDSLAALIGAKAPAERVGALARDLSEKAVGEVGLATYPHRWPDPSRGAALFAQRCAACHGARGRGDGEKAAELVPPPVNLYDPEWMGALSPFAVFNAIRLGVDGTAMAANPDLSDEETWDLAFFAMGLRHQETGGPVPPNVPPELASLEARATLSDSELRGRIEEAGLDGRKVLAALRSDLTPPDSAGALALARRYLSQVEKLVGQGRFDEASRAALSAYLEGIEPIEPALQARSPGQVAELEARMAELRQRVRARDAEGASRALEEARDVVGRAEQSLGAGALAPAVAFGSAAVIVLREGLEAVLIIAVLLGLLKAWRAPHLVRLVHTGWMAALAAGGLTWAASGRLFRLSGAGRETLEGVTGLIAVAVLLYVGFWLHRATVGEQWKQMLDAKARAALEQGRGTGLFLLAFVAVYREAFETVLFYRALWLEGGPSGTGALLGGFAAGALALALICLALFWFEARLPLKQVFGFSALVMALLAFVLMGKAMHSLQESGAVGTDPVGFLGRLDLLGVYPTSQTLLAQGFVLALMGVLWWWASREGAGEGRGRQDVPTASS